MTATSINAKSPDEAQDHLIWIQFMASKVPYWSNQVLLAALVDLEQELSERVLGHEDKY